MEIIYLIVMVTIWWLPVIIAQQRHVANIGTIAVVTGLLGWTGIGWVVALAWSCKTVQPAITAAGGGSGLPLPPSGGYPSVTPGSWQHHAEQHRPARDVSQAMSGEMRKPGKRLALMASEELSEVNWDEVPDLESVVTFDPDYTTGYSVTESRNADGNVINTITITQVTCEGGLRLRSSYGTTLNRLYKPVSE